MIKSFSRIAVFSLIFVLVSCSGFAQLAADVAECLAEGQKCYKNGDLSGAALEFENMLSIDKHNFEAKVWLVQVYIDMKALSKAKAMLADVALAAPDHPRVIELQRLIGTIEYPVSLLDTDPVKKEIMSQLGVKEGVRKYGLVIPENRIGKDNTETELLAFDSGSGAAKEAEIDHSPKETGPFAKIFEIKKKQGLNPALDEYFKSIFQNPALAGVDDKGLLSEGMDLYSKRFADDPKSIENCFYYGALTYMEGSTEGAEEIFKPLRANPGEYRERLKPFLDAVDKWRKAKNYEIAMAKRAEEERLAKEEAEKRRREAEEKERQAREQYRLMRESVQASDSADVSKNVEASEIYKEGYDLYKRGKLDNSIEKFQQALTEFGDKAILHYRLGLAYTDKAMSGDNGFFEAAVTSFQKVIALEPNSKLADESRTMIRDIENVKTTTGQ